MNDFMYDPMAVRQQAVDPMAVRQQPVDPMAVRQQPMPVPGTAVYNNPMAMNAASGIYGSPQMRQNSVMMTAAQENTFGPEGTNPNPEIYNAIKNK